MKLLRFARYFTRVEAANPKETEIRFFLGETELDLFSLTFEGGPNEWHIKLRAKDADTTKHA